MSKTSTYPLRLPRSLKKAVEKQSEEDGTRINQFVAMAVAEELSALQVAEFFADRKARADFKAFDKIMKRRGGKPPTVWRGNPGTAVTIRFATGTERLQGASEVSFNSSNGDWPIADFIVPVMKLEPRAVT
jgi:hypothetical protein